MNKKYAYALTILAMIITTFLPVATVAAQEDLLFGQNHSYSVYLKSNKEAFVFAKLILKNPDEAMMREGSFKLSNAKASEMSIYQVVLPQKCAQYEYKSTVRDRECVRYEDPSYTTGYNYYGGSRDEVEYFKADYRESSGEYRFDLPKPVEAYKSTALVAIYATKDYVNNSLGRHTFDFETLAVDQRVTESQVAITVETDYQLKNPDKTTTRYYRGGANDAMSGATEAGASFSNPDIDKLVYSIGERGQLNKTFKSVTPSETSTVSGMFASSWLRLHMFEVASTILGVVGFFAAIIFLSKKYGKRADRSVPAKLNDSDLVVRNRFTLLTPIYWIASFTSALLVGGLTILVNSLGESGSLDFISNSGPVVVAFVYLTGLFMYLVAIFGPVIYVSVKYKWKAVIVVIAMQLVWYAIAAFLAYSLMN